VCGILGGPAATVVAGVVGVVVGVVAVGAVGAVVGVVVGVIVGVVVAGVVVAGVPPQETTNNTRVSTNIPARYQAIFFIVSTSFYFSRYSLAYPDLQGKRRPSLARPPLPELYSPYFMFVSYSTEHPRFYHALSTAERLWRHLSLH
jgi:hypothetical protein